MKRTSPETPRVHTFITCLDSHLMKGRELTCELKLCIRTYKDCSVVYWTIGCHVMCNYI